MLFATVMSAVSFLHEFNISHRCKEMEHHIALVAYKNKTLHHQDLAIDCSALKNQCALLRILLIRPAGIRNLVEFNSIAQKASQCPWRQSDLELFRQLPGLAN